LKALQINDLLGFLIKSNHISAHNCLLLKYLLQNQERKSTFDSFKTFNFLLR